MSKTIWRGVKFAAFLRQNSCRYDAFNQVNILLFSSTTAITQTLVSHFFLSMSPLRQEGIILVLLFSFSHKLTAKKQGRILKIYWFWISLIIFIKDTVLFKVFHQVNIIFVYNRNFFTKKHIIYNDERGEVDKTRWNSCQNILKKWKQCRFCLSVFLYLRSVFQCALCISRNTFERIQLRGIAFKGDS